jgi:hypothetical protein
MKITWKEILAMAVILLIVWLAVSGTSPLEIWHDTLELIKGWKP